MKPIAHSPRPLASLLSVWLTALATTLGGCGGSSDDNSVTPPVVTAPLPGSGSCDTGVRMNMNITGRVFDLRGRPHVGHVVLRDRALQSGAIFAEASANDAGFFLLGVRGIVTSAGCPRSYVIEVDSRAASGADLYGELDVTSLFPLGATGFVEEDITATPVILAEVE